MKLSHYKNWILLVCLVFIFIFLFCDVLLAEPIDVSKLDVLGIRLGMEPNEVKSIIPNLKIFRQDAKFKEYLKFEAFAGSGLGTSDDWDINAKFTEKPYGKGLYFLLYKKRPSGGLGDLNVFLDGFKKRIYSKYGNPSYEMKDLGYDDSYKIKVLRYYAVWSKFSKKSSKAALDIVNGFYQSSFRNPRGKFLTLKVTGRDFVFRLFDNSPVSDYFDNLEKKTAIKQGQKLKF